MEDKEPIVLMRYKDKVIESQKIIIEELQMALAIALKKIEIAEHPELNGHVEFAEELNKTSKHQMTLGLDIKR